MEKAKHEHCRQLMLSSDHKVIDWSIFGVAVVSEHKDYLIKGYSDYQTNLALAYAEADRKFFEKCMQEGR